MRIEKAASVEAVIAAGHLFDDPPTEAATAKFLTEPGHHLLLAYADDGTPVGMISGVETTHPDKGTEMFLYELGVAETHRRQGYASALIAALRAIARERGCHGMWVPVDADNDVALATYASVGATQDGGPAVVLTWTFDGPA